MFVLKSNKQYTMQYLQRIVFQYFAIDKIREFYCFLKTFGSYPVLYNIKFNHLPGKHIFFYIYILK